MGVAVATHATVGVSEQAAGIALGQALQAGAAWAGEANRCASDIVGFAGIGFGGERSNHLLLAHIIGDFGEVANGAIGAHAGIDELFVGCQYGSDRFGGFAGNQIIEQADLIVLGRSKHLPARDIFE